MRDEGCPTCGSLNFAFLEVKKKSDNEITWKMQCYNCKKLWFTSKHS
jgi:rRNA maturation endonuclease Nob1